MCDCVPPTCLSICLYVCVCIHIWTCPCVCVCFSLCVFYVPHLHLYSYLSTCSTHPLIFLMFFLCYPRSISGHPKLVINEWDCSTRVPPPVCLCLSIYMTCLLHLSGSHRLSLSLCVSLSDLPVSTLHIAVFLSLISFSTFSYFSIYFSHTHFSFL